MQAVIGTTGPTSSARFFSSTLLGKSTHESSSKCKGARIARSATQQGRSGDWEVRFTPEFHSQFVWPPAERSNWRTSRQGAAKCLGPSLSLRDGNPGGGLSRGCKQRVSQRLHVNQLVLDAIDSLNDIYCWCSVGDNAGDLTQAQGIQCGDDH